MNPYVKGAAAMKHRLLRFWSALGIYLVTFSAIYLVQYFMLPQTRMVTDIISPILQWLVCCFCAGLLGSKFTPYPSAPQSASAYLKTCIWPFLVISFAVAHLFTSAGQAIHANLELVSPFAASYVYDVLLGWRALVAYWILYTSYSLSVAFRISRLQTAE